MWAVKSLKFCTLMGFFCPNDIKFQLKKHRRVIFYDTEEWCKVLRKTDFWFQIWPKEFGECSLNHSKVWKFYFDGLFLSKVYKVWAIVGVCRSIVGVLLSNVYKELSFMALNSDAKFA